MNDPDRAERPGICVYLPVDDLVAALTRDGGERWDATRVAEGLAGLSMAYGGCIVFPDMRTVGPSCLGQSVPRYAWGRLRSGISAAVAELLADRVAQLGCEASCDFDMAPGQDVGVESPVRESLTSSLLTGFVGFAVKSVGTGLFSPIQSCVGLADSLHIPLCLSGAWELPAGNLRISTFVESAPKGFPLHSLPLLEETGIPVMTRDMFSGDNFDQFSEPKMEMTRFVR